MIKKNLLPLTVFLFLSLTIPLFAIVFESLPSIRQMSVPHWNVWPYPVRESVEGWIQQDRYLVFKVSPTFPLLFWRLVTYDYYNGFKWQTTTVSNMIDSQKNSSNATLIFSVELNATTNEFYLPTPSSSSTVFNFTTPYDLKFKLFFDEVAGIYQVRLTEPAPTSQINFTYQATWDSLDIHKGNISLNSIPENIRETYLQLPESLPLEVKLFAQKLKNSSLNVFDQILEDVEYIKNNFEYDRDLAAGRVPRVIFQDWVLTFLERKRGICLDAATALAVVLRCQGIPARVCGGFKPSYVLENKAIYYSTSAHALTEVYLPPYGWIPFDATPPGELDSLPEDFPPYGTEVRGPPFYLIRTLTPSTLIRGEQNKIKGLITTNIEKETNHSVSISLDDKEIATIKTDANGSFTHTLYISESEALGNHTLTFVSRNLTLTQEVRVAARTYLNATITKKGLFGSSLIVTAFLLDDQKFPLKGQTITVKNHRLSCQTDNEGKVKFSLDLASPILPENISLVVSFDGSDQYLASTIPAWVSAEPNLIAVSLILAGMFYVVYKENLITKSFTRKLKKNSVQVLTKSPSIIFFEEDFKKIKNSRLKICFTEIVDPFPPVWGVQDKLLIKCTLEHNGEKVSQNKLKIFINDNLVFEEKVDDNRCFSFYHVFDKKGLQKIIAVLHDDSNKTLDATEIALRIVDYREEIIRLYHAFLQNLIQSCMTVKDYMTAREIQYMLQPAGMSSLNAKCITDCFEKAEYSPRSVTRRSYETMYLALKELNVNVE
jgi:transglutaminase-like putative cysteine protease